jgi:hypothetical protein
MLRRTLLCSVLAALSFAPGALADGGWLDVTQAWEGVASDDGSLRYVTIPAANGTTVEAIRTDGGRVDQFGSLAGSFGIPAVAADGTSGGLSRDGKTLVLADAARSPRTVTHFAVLNAKQLYRGAQMIVLPGDWGFDALSPNGRMLYLIQRTSPQNLYRYVVRAYDLDRDRLLPQRIADRTQRSWVMQGYPMARATSADGRFVYTFYQNPGGTPFVHALDAVTMTAHCIGIPWKGGADQNAMWNLRLSLHDGDRALALRWRSGRPYLAIDTRTYRLSYPGSDFPWLVVVGGALGAGLLAGAAALFVRRRRGQGLDELEALLALEAREPVEV